MKKDGCTKQINEKTKKYIKLAIEVFLLAGLVCLTVYLFPLIMKLEDETVRCWVRDFIKDRGAVGVLILIGIQLLQVILSVIPGEPVEVLFGFIYGPWIGCLICLGGILLGSFLVFVVTRFLGKGFMDRIEKSGKYDKFSFLKDPAKRDFLIFIMFFIPGTPKDTLTYFAPFTKIGLGKFLLISTIARIPSVITSTFAGESIFTGDFVGSVIIFAITGSIGIIGIIVYNFILKKNSAKKELSEELSNDQ